MSLIPFGCNPLQSGDWTITKSCAVYSGYTASGNVIIDITDNAKVLMIIQGSPLTINFDTKHLMVKDGNKVMIYDGAKISSP